ncbi:MAG: hypothetical protein IKT10_00755 [Clostridiales bacterium]|nr:hypothetical protein [Clostridiales bacterium]
MPNDPEDFNKINGVNNPSNKDDFVDSSFAVQFKPGDKTESIADKLKETKENIEKQSSSINQPASSSRFDFNSSDAFKDKLSDEFDNFEFDSSISAFKPFKTPEQTSSSTAATIPAIKPAPSSNDPVFPKNGGTFDKPAFTAKAPEPSKEALPKFNDAEKAQAKPSDDKLFKSGSGLDFATSEHDKKTSPFMNTDKPDLPKPANIDIPTAEKIPTPKAEPAKPASPFTSAPAKPVNPFATEPEKQKPVTADDSKTQASGGYRPYPSAAKTNLFTSPAQATKEAEKAFAEFLDDDFKPSSNVPISPFKSVNSTRPAATSAPAPAKSEAPAAPVKPAAPAVAATPAAPVVPVTPAKSTEPAKSIIPDIPAKPAQPAKPAEPVNPASNVIPVKRPEAVKPAEPAKPVVPVAPAAPAKPAEPAKAATPASVATAAATGAAAAAAAAATAAAVKPATETVKAPAETERPQRPAATAAPAKPSAPAAPATPAKPVAPAAATAPVKPVAPAAPAKPAASSEAAQRPGTSTGKPAQAPANDAYSPFEAKGKQPVAATRGVAANQGHDNKAISPVTTVKKSKKKSKDPKSQKDPGLAGLITFLVIIFLAIGILWALDNTSGIKSLFGKKTVETIATKTSATQVESSKEETETTTETTTEATTEATTTTTEATTTTTEATTTTTEATTTETEATTTTTEATTKATEETKKTAGGEKVTDIGTKITNFKQTKKGFKFTIELKNKSKKTCNLPKSLNYLDIELFAGAGIKSVSSDAMTFKVKKDGKTYRGTPNEIAIKAGDTYSFTVNVTTKESVTKYGYNKAYFDWKK